MTDQNVSEPKVSVHGIPQSQYEAGGPTMPDSGGQEPGAGGFFKQHWMLTTLGLGVVAILVYMWWSNNMSNAASAAQTSTSGVGTGNSSPDQMWGAQLDADYQQMQQTMTTNQSLLQQLLNMINSPSTSPPVSVAPPPPTTPTTPGGSTGGSGKWKMITTMPGQTLEGVALANGYHDIQGSAAWQQLYNAGPGGTQGGGNAYTIATAAKSHGVTQHFQNFIYPGEKLYVPA